MAYSHDLSLTVALGINFTKPVDAAPWFVEIAVREVDNPVAGFPTPLLAFDRDPNTGQLTPTTLTVQVWSENGTLLGSAPLANETIIMEYAEPHDWVEVVFPGTALYEPLRVRVHPQHDPKEIVQNLGLDPRKGVSRMAFLLFRQYVATSGAFTKMTETTYEMIPDEMTFLWHEGIRLEQCIPFTSTCLSLDFSIQRGYEVVTPVRVTEKELTSGRFNTNETIIVRRHYGYFDVFRFPDDVRVQRVSEHVLTKEEFFKFWLGIKLHPWHVGSNPPAPEEITEFDSLVADILALLRLDADALQAKRGQLLAARVWGQLSYMLVPGGIRPIFEECLTDLLQCAIRFVKETFMNPFLETVSRIIDTIVTGGTSLAELVLTTWDQLISPHVNIPAIELVKYMTQEIVTPLIEGAKAIITSHVIDPAADEFELSATIIDLTDKIWKYWWKVLEDTLMCLWQLLGGNMLRHLLIGVLVYLFVYVYKELDRLLRIKLKVMGDYRGNTFVTPPSPGTDWRHDSRYRQDTLSVLPDVFFAALSYLGKTVTELQFLMPLPA